MRNDCTIFEAKAFDQTTLQRSNFKPTSIQLLHQTGKMLQKTLLVSTAANSLPSFLLTFIVLLHWVRDINYTQNGLCIKAKDLNWKLLRNKAKKRCFAGWRSVVDFRFKSLEGVVLSMILFGITTTSNNLTLPKSDTRQVITSVSNWATFQTHVFGTLYKLNMNGYSFLDF